MKQYTFLNESMFGFASLYTNGDNISDIVNRNWQSQGIDPNIANKASKEFVRGAQVGTPIGALAGGYLGTKIANKLTGKKERMLIKDIIINSKNVDDAINSIKKIGTNKAQKYCVMLDNLRNNPNWKNDILTSINIKNGLSTTAGALGGGYLGAGIGLGTGGLINSSGTLIGGRNLVK